MTEDQKAMSLILELLAAAKGVPVAYKRLEQDVKYCGYRMELHGILDELATRKLVKGKRDGLGVVRYTITPAGKEALDEQ